MFRTWIDVLWHKRMGRPYRLHVGIDQNPMELNEVLLLHGIGRSSTIWEFVAQDLAQAPYHVFAFDLLGFGASPKPDWPNYSVNDHAEAVLAALLHTRRYKRPITIVGHSMGCLVAVQIATLRPDLVDRLILYQPPLYIGLPESRRYHIRTDLYYRLYRRLIAEPTPGSSARLRQQLIKRTGIQVQPETLQPFLKSLEHTIMEQTTLHDMRKLQIPIDVIYGSRDIIVIRGKSKNIFKEITAPLRTHTIRELHTVSKSASAFLVQRIVAGTQEDVSVTTQTRHRIIRR